MIFFILVFFSAMSVCDLVYFIISVSFVLMAVSIVGFARDCLTVFGGFSVLFPLFFHVAHHYCSVSPSSYDEESKEGSCWTREVSCDI